MVINGKVRFGLAGALLLVLTFALAACSSESVTPTPTLRPGETPQPAPEPTATPIATQEVEFRVAAPDTGDGNPVRLLIMFAGSFQDLRRIPMTKQGDVWTATAHLPPGGFIHYVYDHVGDDDPFDVFLEKREAHGKTVQIHSRLLHVAPGRTQVDDVVETWAGDRRAASTGTLAGTVVDATTGQPLIDVDVTAGGVHIATDFEGRFEFRDIAAGRQRVTAHTTLGEHGPADSSGTVVQGEIADVTITMEPVTAVDVTFDVTLPDDTPADAVIRMAGNVFQLGAARIHENLPRLVQDISLPSLERVSPTRARGTFRLHEGTYLNYYYTLAGTFPGREFTSEDQFAYHEGIVTSTSPTISDQVEAWKNQNQRLVELRITTPPNTDPDAFLAVSMGPSHIASRVSRTEFATYLTGAPGEELTYYLSLGDTLTVAGLGAGAGPNGQRTVTVGEADTVQHLTVERWGSYPAVSAAAPGTEIDIAFRASLPGSTPADAEVRVVVEAGPAARSFGLTKVEGAQLWQGTLRLPTSAEVSYRIDASGAEPRVGPDRTLTVEYVGQVVDDWVTTWDDSSAARADYITGVYTPDLWSDAMQPLTEPTYRRIAEHNGGWVALSSVWHYGQILPLPTVESRQLYAPSVRTPRPHVVEQARKAREAGLKTILAPQFNMEMVPGFSDQLNQVSSNAWWDGWFEVAEELWLYHADLAAEIDAELLLLPGFVFHVYSGPGRFESQEAFEAFDERLIALSQRVRDVYPGKILISGGVEESEFPGVADLVGVTTYDTGVPDLPPTASAEEWHAAYDVLFQESVDPLWERWGVPVLFYTINIEAPNDGDGDEVEQATQLEGIMRAVEDRHWIAGSFMWAYHMVAEPLADHGLRDRLGEVVMARYYGAFGGRD